MMDLNLQHEDLLIRLRAKLNEEKIKLWESPYIENDNKKNEMSENLQELARKYSRQLSLDYEVVLQALYELQLHSLDRSKANAEFQETGLATFRIKATLSGVKPKVLKVQKKLSDEGSDLISVVAGELGVEESRVKLIYNGKVIKPTPSLQEQGMKNGVQLMALVMTDSPEEVKKQDNMYMEMKSTRDDALLLSECAKNLGNDEYMKLEDQSGKTVELPAAERRSLLVGLALHERGRAAAKQRNYSLALVLLLEADRQLSECRSSILNKVDNWGVLQLDIAWCYLCLQNLSSANDAAARLARAEEAFRASYGENHQRLIALKGTAANERVLIMRLYLLQGIVAYHQNKRADARRLLEKAEYELSCLRVDDNAVMALTELGWTQSQARTGLRATGGDVDRAHHYLEEKHIERERAREKHRTERLHRKLGLCVDGTPVNQQLVQGLISMGYKRRLAVAALRNSNNHVAEAVRLIQEQPELLANSDEESSEEGSSETTSSEDSFIEPDNKLVGELEAMGYTADDAKVALRMSRNHVSGAVDLLVASAGHMRDNENSDNPSTSAGAFFRKQKKQKRDKSPSHKKKEREQALQRLSSAIQTEEDDHLNTSLVEEEEFLVQYKSLL